MSREEKYLGVEQNRSAPVRSLGIKLKFLNTQKVLCFQSFNMLKQNAYIDTGQIQLTILVTFSNERDKHNGYKEYCVSFESITVQSNYCLNFLPEKERNETKSNIALIINIKSHLNQSQLRKITQEKSKDNLPP